jgi:hypothetical protein
MIPSSFDEVNLVLDAPPTLPDLEPLNVFVGLISPTQPVIISCWKMTKEEIEEFTRTGRVWLVVQGMGMPPVLLSGIKPSMRMADEPDSRKENDKGEVDS